MSYDIELMSIGEDIYPLLERSAAALNGVQNEFRFHLTSLPQRQSGVALQRSKYATSEIWMFLRNQRTRFGGRRPYIIAFVAAGTQAGRRLRRIGGVQPAPHAPQRSDQNPLRIVIWSGEDDPADTLVPRLEASGADLSRVFFAGEMSCGKECRAFDPAKDIPALQTAIEAAGGAKMVIARIHKTAECGISLSQNNNNVAFKATTLEGRILSALARIHKTAECGISLSQNNNNVAFKATTKPSPELLEARDCRSASARNAQCILLMRLRKAGGFYTGQLRMGH